MKHAALAAEPAGLFDATALLTFFFDPEKATCPNLRSPDRDPPPPYRPEPRVTRHDERTSHRADRLSALSAGRAQPLP